MKLEEAIEELERGTRQSRSTNNQRLRDALKLGIEALKWRALMEHDYGSWCGPLLPGETEE